MPDQQNRLIVITGAASGIGRLLAGHFIRNGDCVVGMDIDESGLAAASDAFGDRFIPTRIDLADPDDIDHVFAQVIDEHGTVDILVNNAGIVAGKWLQEHTQADVRRTFAINVESHLYTTQAVLPAMIAKESGHIVTVASAGGFAATARMAAYGASKFAAVGFDDALRVEMKRLGHPIHTTLIAPFYINTGMFDGVKTRFSWLLPILDPEKVAAKSFKAIQKRKRRLIMPRFVYTTFLVRLLPVDLYDWVADFFGVTRTMDDFRGRG